MPPPGSPYEEQKQQATDLHRDVAGKDRLRDRWYYFKTFSLGRGSTIELDIDDEVIKSLHEIGWVHRINDEWFMTRRGSREFNQFLREEHDRIGKRKRKKD